MDTHDACDDREIGCPGFIAGSRESRNSCQMESDELKTSCFSGDEMPLKCETWRGFGVWNALGNQDPGELAAWTCVNQYCHSVCCCFPAAA